MPDLLSFYLSTVSTGALVSVVVGLAYLTPGLVPAMALAQRLRLRADETVLAALAISTSIAGIASMVCYYLWLPLWAAAAITLAAAGGLAWRFRSALRRPAPAARRASRLRLASAAGFVAALAAWAVSGLEGTWFGEASDAFYHVAAIRTMVDRGLPVVTDPLYGTASRVLDVTAGAWHSMLAMVALVTRLPADELWMGLSPFVTAMFVLGFFALARRVSGRTWAAAVATATWVLADLLLDTRLIVMPQTGALVFVFTMMLGLLALAEDPTPAASSLAVAAGVAAVLTHLGVGELAVIVLGVACASMLVLARAELRETDTHWVRTTTPMLQTAAVTLAIVAMPLAQRLWTVAHSWVLAPQASYLRAYAIVVPVFGVMPQLAWAVGRAMSWYGWPLTAAAVALTLAGDVLLLGMAVAAWRSRDPRRVLAAAFAGLAFLILRLPLFSWLLSSVAAYMTVRLLLLVAFCPYLVLAWALAQSRATGGWRGALRPFAIGVCAIAVLASLPGVRSTFVEDPSTLRRGEGSGIAKMFGRDIRYEWGADAIATVRAEVGTGYPLVASDSVTGYELAAVAPVAVVAVPGTHSPFFMEGASHAGDRRRLDMQAFMRPGASGTLRREVLARYRPAYVAVSSDTRLYPWVLLSLKRQPDLFEPVVLTPRLALFRVK